VNDVTRVRLAAQVLDAQLRVTPTPTTALVSIDGVVVGHGAWEGKLRSGAHVVEVAADGFVPARREAALLASERTHLEIALERDATSPLWGARHPGRVFAEVDAGLGAGLLFGGAVRTACTGPCSAHVPLGPSITLHAGYAFASGLAIGLDGGLLALAAGTSGRATPLYPKGLAADSGTADDAIYLRGARVGPSAAYRFDAAWPVTLRLGAGVFVGSAGDARTGAFTTAAGEPFTVSVSESARALYAYVAPEARVAWRITDRLDVSAGLSLIFLAAIDAPSWTDAHPVLAAPPGRQGDGVATFGAQSTAGTFVVVAAPSIGVRYAL
jgi:hypothetical protein